MRFGIFTVHTHLLYKKKHYSLTSETAVNSDKVRQISQAFEFFHTKLSVCTNCILIAYFYNFWILVLLYFDLNAAE